MDKAVQRIYTAVINKEKILIFGDFDADGVTATAMLLPVFVPGGGRSYLVYPPPG